MLLGRTPPPRCSRLGVVCLAYLWRRDQEELLQEMIEAGVKAVIIKVASMGRSRLPCLSHFCVSLHSLLFLHQCCVGLTLDKHLGKTIAEVYPELCELVRVWWTKAANQILCLIQITPLSQPKLLSGRVGSLLEP